MTPAKKHGSVPRENSSTMVNKRTSERLKLIAKLKYESKLKVPAPDPTPEKGERKAVENTDTKDIFIKVQGMKSKNLEPFIQNGTCLQVVGKKFICRECCLHQSPQNDPAQMLCRFDAFRMIGYTKNGYFGVGFTNPHKHPSPDDIKIWIPDSKSPPADLDMNTSRYLLSHISHHFCNLFQNEKEVTAEYLSLKKKLGWKKNIQGVREMCDVCNTSLFNYHWICEKCGFAVCLDCFTERKRKLIKPTRRVTKERDTFSWLFCGNHSSHDLRRLLLTQVIAGDSFQCLEKHLHELLSLWQIPAICGCQESSSNGDFQEVIRNLIKTETEQNSNTIKNQLKLVNGPHSIVKDEKENNSIDFQNDSSSGSSDEEGQDVKLYDLAISVSDKFKDAYKKQAFRAPKLTKMETQDLVLNSIKEMKVSKQYVDDITKDLELYCSTGTSKQRKKYPPIRIMTYIESKRLYPGVPHTWLCNGKVLQLRDSTHSGNIRIFQDQWKRGQPVLVSNVSDNLCQDLWRPEAFVKEFGKKTTDLIDCTTGYVLPNQSMKSFWNGFLHVDKRLTDIDGEPMLLKFKDWPGSGDFAKILPMRFNDLMKALPLGDYTQRTGRFNLVSRLPEAFVPPDLGPKMYCAYGTPFNSAKGTTNLHLDISDAVNVMVYVGIPKNRQYLGYISAGYRAIAEGGCDPQTLRRVRQENVILGALWHIYAAKDADKIRHFLNRVAIEKGIQVLPNGDPIHDQTWYLDKNLRNRLYTEYGVEGYAIAQCCGDAIFIPAGAPHQVWNLSNCIKVAEDFVSPENISHCLYLTDEFRKLKHSHPNSEDKLQIKNIIYHTVKDAVGCLLHVFEQNTSEQKTSVIPAVTSCTKNSRSKKITLKKERASEF